MADVGRDLNIASVQDTSTFKSRDQSIGGSATIGYGSGASVNASRSRVDADYASVGQQAGIMAGDGGFQINVKGNTDLKGAQIASTDKAVEEGKNSLTTGTLTSSDIQNRSQYSAESQSVSAGTSGGKPGGGAGIGNASGSETSVTRSGVSGGAVKITDAQAQQAKTGQSPDQVVASLDTSVRTGKDSSNSLAKNWNGNELREDVEAQAKITQAFGQQASKLIGDYAEEQTKKAAALRTQADAATDPAAAKELNDQAAAIERNWGPDGTARVLAHTVVGGLTGGLAGAAGAAAGTLTAPTVAEALKTAGVDADLAKVLTGLSSTLVGTAVGGTAGGSAAYNEVINNYLRHVESERLTALSKKKALGQCDADCEREMSDLLALDVARDRAVANCVGVSSAACDKTRELVRTAAAEYIRNGEVLNTRGSYYGLQSARTTMLAYETIDGQAAGVWQSVKDMVSDLSEAIALGYRAKDGDPQAIKQVVANTKIVTEFLSDANNLPYLIGFMTPAQREVFASAVESNDGKTVGKMLTDQTVAFIGTLSFAGDAAKLATLSTTALRDAMISARTPKVIGVTTGANELALNGEGLFTNVSRIPYAPKNQLLGQAYDFSCAAASCTMAANLADTPEAYVRQAILTDTSGTSLSNIPNGLNQLGFTGTAKYSTTVTAQSISEATSSGASVIVNVKTESGGIHAIVVDSVKNGVAYIRDPWPKGVGSSYGVPVDSLGSALTGKGVIIHP